VTIKCESGFYTWPVDKVIYTTKTEILKIVVPWIWQHFSYTSGIKIVPAILEHW
jgi:hypothetical protein